MTVRTLVANLREHRLSCKASALCVLSFDGKITVQAFNRTTEEWSNEYTIVMNEKELGPSYVKRHVNILADKGCGKPDYLSMSELKEYSKQANVIRFRVAKVEVFS